MPTQAVVLGFARDLAERAVWTFVQAFLGVFAVSNVSSVAELHALALAAVGAGIAAVASLVKGVAAGAVTGSPATLRQAHDPAPVVTPPAAAAPVTPADHPEQPAAGTPPPA